MANCHVSPTDFAPIIKKLLLFDRDRYVKFDEVARWVLSQDWMPDNQKVLAVHNIATIYTGLHGMDSGVYVLGEANRLSRLNDLVDDTYGYMAVLGNLYPTEPKYDDQHDVILRAIANLNSIPVHRIVGGVGHFARPEAIPPGVRDILTMIDRHLGSREIAVADAWEYRQKMVGVIRDKIATLDPVAVKSRGALLTYELPGYLEKNAPHSTYVSLREMDLGPSTHQITLRNGDTVMAQRQEDKGFVQYFYQSVTGMVPIAPSDIRGISELMKPDNPELTGNQGEFLFHGNDLAAGFALRSVEGIDRTQVDGLSALRNRVFAPEQVRFMATLLPATADERVEAIRSADPDAMSGRFHETFENARQVARLSGATDGIQEILTVCRPKASEHVFQLVGVLPDGSSFLIHSLRNMVFVDSNNNTTSLDLNNPEHLAKLGELAQVRGVNGEHKAMSEADLQTMRNAWNYYDQFFQKVVTQFSENPGEYRLDVSDSFREHYNMSSGVPATEVPLTDFLSAHPDAMQEFELYQRGADGLPQFVGKRPVPIVMYKASQKDPWKISDTLGEDLFVLHNGEYLNLLDLHNALTGSDAPLHEQHGVLPGAKPKAYLLTPTGTGFRLTAAVPSAKLEAMPNKAGFIGGIGQLLGRTYETTEDSRNAFFHFDKNQFHFKVHHGLAANLQPRWIKNPEGKWQLIPVMEIVGEKNGTLAALFTAEVKKKLVFPLPTEMFTEFVDQVFGSEALKNAKARYLELDRYSEKHAAEFGALFADIDRIRKVYPNDPDLAELARLTDTFDRHVGTALKERVIDRIMPALESLGEEGAPLRNEIIARMTSKTGSGALNLHQMLVEYEDLKQTGGAYVYRPKPISAQNNGMVNNYNIATRSTLGQISVRPNPNLTVSEPKTQTPSEPAVPELVATEPEKKKRGRPRKAAAAAAAEPVTAETGVGDIILPGSVVDDGGSASDLTEGQPAGAPKKARGRKTTTKGPKEAFDGPQNELPFMIGTAGQGDPSVQEAHEWLANHLPQFGLRLEDLRELFDLTRVDGQVLGLFAGKVIHLDRRMATGGTLYHEAFHGVFRLLLSSFERQQLIARVLEQNGVPSEAEILDFARARKLDERDNRRIVELMAEEMLAEGFRKHMTEKSTVQPRSWMQRLFDVLKRVLDMFRKHTPNEINQLFDQIATGHFKNAEIIAAVDKGTVAYQLIPVRYELNLKEASKYKPASEITPSDISMDKRFLTVAEQNELRFRVASEVLTAMNRGMKFNDAFEAVRKQLYSTFYQVENLVAQNPGKEDAIWNAFGFQYENFRYVLGAGVDGAEDFTAENNTGSEEFDNRYENPQRDGGQESLNLLKAEVRRLTEPYSRLITDQVQDEQGQEGMEGEDDPEGATSETDSDELGARYDESFMNMNALKSLSREFRRFFAMSSYTVRDTHLGIDVPRMVDGDRVFPLIMKICSDTQPDLITRKLSDAAARYADDGHGEVADMLQAVYNRLQAAVGLDQNGLPIEQANMRMYHQFLDVFHTTELDVYNVNLETADMGMEGENAQGKEIRIEKKASVGQVFETLLQSDSSRRMQAIVHSLVQASASDGNKKYFKNNAGDLVDILSARVLVGDKASILPLTDSPARMEADLNRLTDQLYAKMSTLGLGNIPKSLVRMSLLAIDVKEHGVILPEGSSLQVLYRDNKLFIERGQYLNKYFFRKLKDMASDAKQDMVDLTGFSGDEGKRYRIMTTILRRSMPYVVRQDPDLFPSTIRNAEGKSVYRFVKYTPPIMIAQEIRQNGVLESISATEVFQDYMKTWYSDNPATAFALKEGPLSAEDQSWKQFFNYLSLGIFSGIRQHLNGKSRDGQMFAEMDERSILLANIMAFANRSVIENSYLDAATGKMVENRTTMFQRSFSQEEASGTNYFITSRYKQYAGTDVNTRELGGEMLLPFLRQEYNRIQNEWGKIDERKTRMDQGDNSLLAKFNAVGDAEHATQYKTDESGNRVPHDGLRAFQFRVFEGLFTPKVAHEDLDQKSLDTIHTLLRNHAMGLNGTKMTSFEELPKNVLDGLKAMLRGYAGQELTRHKAMLRETGLVDEKFDSPFIPRDMRTTESNDAIAINNYEPQKGHAYGSMENFLTDHFFNFWMNSLAVNQLFDGDMAMGIKNGIDLFKRNKSHIISGSAGKRGHHKVAYINEQRVVLDKDHLELGQWDSLDDIPRDLNVDTMVQTEEGLKEKTINVYDHFRALADADPNKQPPTELVLDGQSYSSIMHRMDVLEQQGRLTPKTESILIAAHYRKLTAEEIEALAEERIVLNSQKSATGSAQRYHKLSEHAIMRSDSSHLVSGLGGTKSAEMKLDELYRQVYATRKRIAEQMLDNVRNYVPINDQVTHGAEQEIQRLMTEIHSYFRPRRGREVIHHMLNSMEMHNIDMMMDPNSSKKVTTLPVTLRRAGTTDLSKSQVWVDNRFKYNQVETSGVKSKIKDSIQPRVIISAEVDNLIQSSATMSPETKDHLTNALIAYAQSQTKIAARSKHALYQMILEDGDINVGFVFDLIREALAKQGTDTNTLSFFETRDGEPVHNVNLPEIRDVFKYYLTSLYSNNAHDVKGAGRKDTHASSLGYQVLYNKATGEIIPDDLIEMYPTRYDSPEYGTRHLGFVTEVINGQTVKFAEVLVPDPGFEDEEERAFYLAELNRMFSTRVPTEGKQSMIAAKVVGFINPAYRNTVIVPQAIHLLAGSDLDIDALYSQIQATYRDFTGKLHKYGSYNRYDEEVSRSMAQFQEYAKYQQKSPMLADRIEARIAELSEEGTIDIPSHIMHMAHQLGIPGYAELDLETLLSEKARYEELVREEKQSLHDLRGRIEREYATSDRNRSTPELDRLIVEESERSHAFGVLKSQLRELRSVAGFYVPMLALTDTLQAVGLPTTPEQLDEYVAANGSPVVPVLQNQNVAQKLTIISNPDIFYNSYLFKLADPTPVASLMKVINSSSEKIAGRYNPFTIAGVTMAKLLNTSAKSGTAVAANMKKIHAVLQQSGAIISSELVPWYQTTTYVDESGIKQYDDHLYDSFQPDSGSLLGTMLAIIVDGAKDPITAVLGVNDMNLSSVLSMMATGVPKEMAIWINFLPEIKKATDEAMKANSGLALTNENKRVTTGMMLDRLYLKNFYDKVFHDRALNALMQADVAGVNPYGQRDIYWDRIGMTYTAPTQIDTAANLTPADLGFGFFSKKTGAPITDVNAQKMLLMDRYQLQEAQNLALSEAGKAINLLKKLNPDFDTLDKKQRAVASMREGKVFANASELFKSDTVFGQLSESLNNLQRQFAGNYLIRKPFLRPLVSLLKSLGDSRVQEDFLTGYFSVGRMLNRHLEGVPDEGNVKLEHAYLKEMQKADFWHGKISEESEGVVTTLTQDWVYLTVNHSDNPFVRNIILQNPYDDKIKYIQSAMRSKPESSTLERIQDGYNLLLKSKDPRTRLIARKFYFQEVMRTGGGRMPGMISSFVNSSMHRELSDNLHELGNLFARMENDLDLIVEEAGDKLDEGEVLNELMGMFETDLNEYFGGEEIPLHKRIGDILDKVFSAPTGSHSAEKTPTKPIRFGNSKSRFGAEALGKEKSALIQGSLEAMFGFPAEGTKGGTADVFNSGREEVHIRIPGPQSESKDHYDLERSLLRHYGIALRADREGFNQGIFPLEITNDKGVTFRLKTVDNQTLGEIVTRDMVRQFYEPPARGTQSNMYSRGFHALRDAVYVKVETSGTDQIKNTAFSPEQAVRLGQLSTGKARLTSAKPATSATAKPKVERPVVPFTKERLLRGDILSLPGQAVIPTNMIGAHESPLADAAMAQGFVEYRKDGAFGNRDGRVITFPVKHGPKDKLDRDLFLRSAEDLVEYAHGNPRIPILLPLISQDQSELDSAWMLPVLKRILDICPNVSLVLSNQGNAPRVFQDQGDLLIKDLLGSIPETPAAPVSTKRFSASDKTLKVGSVVDYKDSIWLVWKLNNATGKVHLIKTTGEKYPGTPNVETVKDLVKGAFPVVSYKGQGYIATDQGSVYSVLSGQKMVSAEIKTGVLASKSTVADPQGTLGFTEGPCK